MPDIICFKNRIFKCSRILSSVTHQSNKHKHTGATDLQRNIDYSIIILSFDNFPPSTDQPEHASSFSESEEEGLKNSRLVK